MMFSKSLGLATALATMASALPSGMLERRTAAAPSNGVLIINNLNQDIYAWSVDTTSKEPAKMITLSAHGGTYVENYRTLASGGVSIKLATEPSQDDVLQFEYTPTAEQIFWDLSCINMKTGGSKFTQLGYNVKPSSIIPGSCPEVNCAAGNSHCEGAYNVWNDDHATHGCPLNTGLTMTIGQSGNGSQTTGLPGGQQTAQPTVQPSAQPWIQPAGQPAQ
ncbi:hypothetical protein NUU61_004938 [Penicillium alfredii]|uniref:Uncharacterized protein n=1 Tax=Penicillium alfredii TaxID=1506179 RepID=A0A9W9K828_9EURO|nr:uncharacterized protein NUU61_004938 [Penicillium alfredii]KAJ5095582.1 hypothetical protein NUU61_004938 [Penicillium alfredii]